MQNPDTLPSAFKVLLMARDAKSTKGADRQVLNALIMRAKPEKKYSCYPAYELLAEDTNLNIKTVKRAAQDLEKAGLIRRRIRHNQSNLFFINVRRLQEQVAEREAEEAARKKASEEEFDGFGDLMPITDSVDEDDYAGTGVETRKSL